LDSYLSKMVLRLWRRKLSSGNTLSGLATRLKTISQKIYRADKREKLSYRRLHKVLRTIPRAKDKDQKNHAVKLAGDEFDRQIGLLVGDYRLTEDLKLKADQHERKLILVTRKLDDSIKRGALNDGQKKFLLGRIHAFKKEIDRSTRTNRKFEKAIDYYGQKV